MVGLCTWVSAAAVALWLPTASLALQPGCSAEQARVGWVKAPVPPRIFSILTERWDELDDGASEMLAAMRARPAFAQFSHARDVFSKHLLGTFATLGAWGQPRDVMRAGLWHTSYSGDLFQFTYWDAAQAADRAELRSLVGAEAEELIFTFGTVHRATILGLGDVMNTTLLAAPGELDADADNLSFRNRLLGPVELTSAMVAKVVVVTLADYLDQMATVNGWRDHHQQLEPEALFPGQDPPAIALHWITRMCKAVRGSLEVIPEAFDNCTATLSHTDEVAARDAYWQATLEEKTLGWERQLELYAAAAALNPFVGEPHLMLAQLHFRKRQYAETAEHAKAALERFFVLGTAWDKRRQFAAWIAFARMLLMRANRLGDGLPDMPYDLGSRSSGGMNLVPIRDMIADF